MTSSSKGFVLVKRDFDIMRSIGELRVARSIDISTLHFWDRDTWQPGPHTNCQARLKSMLEHEYLGRKEQPRIMGQGSSAPLYYLKPKGARKLAEHLGCEVSDLVWRKFDPDASEEFLEHALWTNQVRVDITFAIQHIIPNAELITWLDQTQLKRDHHVDKMDWRWPSGKEEIGTRLEPDSYFRIITRNGKELDWKHSLEIDRGTTTGKSPNEDRRTWERKIRLYLHYYKPGGPYQKRYDQGNKGRVMTVTTSEKRLNNLMKLTEEAGGLARYWFTTFDEITPLTVLTKPIWRQCGKEGFYTFFDSKTAYPRP